MWEVAKRLRITEWLSLVEPLSQLELFCVS